MGVVLGATAWVSAVSSAAIRDAGPASLYAILGVSAGVAGIVLGALSIFVAFLNEDYMTVLSHAPGGIKRAWSPYMVVAAASVITALVSLMTVIVWPALSVPVQAALLGLCTGLLAWALTGTAQLVGITKFHGEMRLELFRHVQDTRRLVRERRSSDRTA